MEAINRFKRVFEIMNIERVEGFDEVDNLKVIDIEGVAYLCAD